MATRISDEGRRARPSKALRADIRDAEAQVRADRRAARQHHKQKLSERPKSDFVYVSETEAEKRQRLKQQKIDRDRNEARRRAEPDAAFVNEHVPSEMQAHGDYQPAKINGPLVGKDFEEEMTTIRVVKNRGGTPVERWNSRGDLDGDRLNAIQAYQSAWHLFWTEPRVTANWSSSGGGSVCGAYEENAAKKLAAKALLDMVDDEVFFRKDLDILEIWNNVVIYDEPAGRAGSRLSYHPKNEAAEAAAKAIVLSVASEISIALRDWARHGRPAPKRKRLAGLEHR